MNPTTKLMLASLAPLTIGAANALTQAPSLVPIRAEQEAVVRAFKACVSPVGLTRDLTLMDPAPAMDSAGKLYVLGETGAIRDGYNHTLYVSPDGKTAYIIQAGGIAGTRKVFGPLDAKAGCPAEKPKSEYSGGM